MKKLHLYIILCLVLLLFPKQNLPSSRGEPFFHSIYISYADIRYQEAEGILSVHIRLFSNDLEEALRRLGIPGEPGLEAGETALPQADDFICTYLGNEFQVWANGQPIDFSFLGKKQETDATKISLQAEDICELRQLRIRNSLLFELFDDQTNILRVRAFGKLLNYSLTPRIPEEFVSWQ